jgi:hypothetical protein
MIVMTAAASGQESDLGTKSDEETIGIWQFNALLYQYIVPENRISWWA